MGQAKAIYRTIQAAIADDADTAVVTKTGADTAISNLESEVDVAVASRNDAQASLAATIAAHTTMIEDIQAEIEDVANDTALKLSDAVNAILDANTFPIP